MNSEKASNPVSKWGVCVSGEIRRGKRKKVISPSHCCSRKSVAFANSKSTFTVTCSIETVTSNPLSHNPMLDVSATRHNAPHFEEKKKTCTCSQLKRWITAFCSVSLKILCNVWFHSVFTSFIYCSLHATSMTAILFSHCNTNELAPLFLFFLYW